MISIKYKTTYLLILKVEFKSKILYFDTKYKSEYNLCPLITYRYIIYRIPYT